MLHTKYVNNLPYPPMPNHCSANNKFFEALFKNEGWIEEQSMSDYGQGFLIAEKEDEFYIDEKGNRKQTYLRIQCTLTFCVDNLDNNFQKIMIEISQNENWEKYLRFAIDYDKKSSDQQTKILVNKFVDLVNAHLFKKITHKNIPSLKFEIPHVSSEWIDYAKR